MSDSSSNGYPQASPGAQLDQTFTYDSMNLDQHGYNGHDFGGPGGDFELYGSTAGAVSTGADMFPSLTEGSWGNFNTNFNQQQPALTQPPLNTGHSTLDDLFPELKGH